MQSNIPIKQQSEKTFSLTEFNLASTILFLWFIFVALCFFYGDFYLFRVFFGFPLLVVAPGVLLLQVCKVQPKFDWGYAGLALGISIVFLLTFGLGINFLFPLLGFQPLIFSTLIFSLSVFFLSISLFLIKRNAEVVIQKPQIPVGSMILSFIPVIFVALSVIGALRLNNDYNGNVTLIMLFGIAAFLIALLLAARFVRENIVATALYFISLALLLMTSLRGWGISGHDIQREYRVFQLTKDAGMWSPDFLHDAYNACLSITVLPTIFSEILNIPDAYIYKVLFQVMFAVVPVICFLIAKRYFSQTIALLSSIVVISFPTYFTDMSMLNRQEIAFLLFVLMIYVMFEDPFSLRFKRWLLLVLGIGIVLSHYSTTYIVILIWAITYVGLLIFSYVSRFNFDTKFFNVFFFPKGAFKVTKQPTISLLLIFVLGIFSFTWSNFITQTSDGSIKRVIERTVDAVWHNSENSRSVDTLYSLFSYKKISDEDFLESYIQNVIEPARFNAPRDTYFEEDSVRTFHAAIVDNQTMALTNLGNSLVNLGINVYAFNNTLKLGSAKILQVLLLLGLMSSLFFRKLFLKKMTSEYFLISFAGISFVALMVLIPVLSVEYGVLRAFQQSLFVIAPFVVIGAFVVFLPLGMRTAHVAVSFCVILFFLSSTGAITQSLGGYKAQLHLNNSGPYYDIYYVHDSERRGISWLSEEIAKSEDAEYQSEVQTDRYLSNKISDSSEIKPINDIYPSLLRQNSFVFLGFANTTKNESTIYYNGILLTYQYPLGLIDVHKNKVYDSGSVIIYR